VARLAERGELFLEDSLSSLLPASLLGIVRRRYDVDRITVTHLLSHRSGLRCHTEDPRFLSDILADPGRRWTAAEQVTRAVAMGPPWGPPGELAVYSDTGYVLLGAILERVAEQKLGPALRQLVDYGALGLSSTWFETAEPARSVLPRVRQYVDARDATDWHPSMDLFGGGGLVSTVSDLARFYAALPSRSVFPVLSGTGSGEAALRSGLFEHALDGHQVFSHAGYWGTYACVVPDLNIGAAAMVNQQAAGSALREWVDRMISVCVRDL
ncbi:MAG: serine hydrolase domain-containing protein, partial [Myxococcota bacterium]